MQSTPNARCSRCSSSLNVASKESIIRQYDHEVQGGSVLKPLVGIANDGPGDAAVVRPLVDSRRGLVVACGMNPYFGDFDPYHMAHSADRRSRPQLRGRRRRSGANLPAR